MGVLVPEVPVELDRPRRFIETLNALARWEEVTGLNSRQPDWFVSMLPVPASPCPRCGDADGAPFDPDGDVAEAHVCAKCAHEWAKVEHKENLNHAQWSAYVWALLIEDDPTLDGDDGLAEVRSWLGDPHVYASASVGIAQLQLTQLARAMNVKTKPGSASEGTPPPGTTSGRPPSTTSD